MSTPDPFAAVAALPGLAEPGLRARAAVDRLAGLPALKLRGPEVVAVTALRGARASAALAGVDVSEDDLRSGSALSDPVAGSVARGAVRLSTEIGLVAPVWEKAPLQALARLHAVAAADVDVPPESLGRPATAEAAARLDVLADALTSPTRAPAIVVAAIVHAEVLTTEAFGPWSGLVARAAARCLLIQRGLDAGGVVAPEVGHVELGLTEYQIAAAGYSSGTAEGVASWVVHCARALEIGAGDALQVCLAHG
ncbi:oxidoreductase [Sporichthya brevicatena]|uniref:Oxidoreductase n=1 Tax=Sporichthya brevicatena TaxID=171442 RepID=A0ABN1G2K8_9ACTN